MPTELIYFPPGWSVAPPPPAPRLSCSTLAPCTTPGTPSGCPSPGWSLWTSTLASGTSSSPWPRTTRSSPGWRSGSGSSSWQSRRGYWSHSSSGDQIWFYFFHKKENITFFNKNLSGQPWKKSKNMFGKLWCIKQNMFYKHLPECLHQFLHYFFPEVSTLFWQNKYFFNVTVCETTALTTGPSSRSGLSFSSFSSPDSTTRSSHYGIKHNK